MLLNLKERCKPGSVASFSGQKKQRQNIDRGSMEGLRGGEAKEQPAQGWNRTRSQLRFRTDWDRRRSIEKGGALVHGSGDDK